MKETRLIIQEYDGKNRDEVCNIVLQRDDMLMTGLFKSIDAVIQAVTDTYKDNLPTDKPSPSED